MIFKKQTPTPVDEPNDFYSFVRARQEEEDQLLFRVSTLISAIAPSLNKFHDSGGRYQNKNSGKQTKIAARRELVQACRHLEEVVLLYAQQHSDTLRLQD